MFFLHVGPCFFYITAEFCILLFIQVCILIISTGCDFVLTTEEVKAKHPTITYADLYQVGDVYSCFLLHL